MPNNSHATRTSPTRKFHAAAEVLGKTKVILFGLHADDNPVKARMSAAWSRKIALATETKPVALRAFLTSVPAGMTVDLLQVSSQFDTPTRFWTPGPRNVEANSGHALFTAPGASDGSTRFYGGVVCIAHGGGTWIGWDDNMSQLIIYTLGSAA